MRFVARCAAAAALLGVALLAACALAPKFQTPELSIVNVQVQGSDLLSQHLKVRVHVHNPNDRALPVRALEYTIEVEGQQFATGESANAFVVPALGDAEFDMNVTTDLAGTLIRLFARATGNLPSEIQYRLYGKLSLSQGLLRSIPFDQRGTFKLQ
jgi:LEA14-like dessication related protein